MIALKIFISRKMEENTLELSFEVDVSEGDEEEDRNYSLDSDNDDGDLGDFDPEAGENQDAAVGGVPVQPAAYLHEPGPRLLDDDDDRDDERWRNQDVSRLDPNNTGNWYVDNHILIKNLQLWFRTVFSC